MNEQEVNQYLDDLLNGKIKAEGVDFLACQRLREANMESGKLESYISRAVQDLDQARVRLNMVNGKREAYAQLLIDSEDGRRRKAEEDLKREAPKQPTAKGVPRVTPLNTEERKAFGDILGRDIEKAELVPAGGK